MAAVDRSRPRSASLTFLGAAGTVTGSRFLVESGSSRVLLDCGLFQGLKELRLRNWRPFPVDPGSLDAVAVTHAHVDHVGYLPVLVRDGFRGPVLASPGTVALSGIVLPDSGRLQEEEAAYAARLGYSKHRSPLPLYTEADARRALPRFRAVPIGEPVPLGEAVTVTLHHAGHILGAGQVALTVSGGSTLWATGDLGRDDHPLLLPPAPLGDADVLVVESTYGNRRHEPREAGVAVLADVIRRTDERGGMTVIPAFAVDRTELLLMGLRLLRAEGRIPALPVYVDSPMALAALAVYRAALRTDPHIRPDVADGGDPFDPGHLTELRSPEESRGVNRRQRGILISASGMATGGRVLHHLAQRLPDARNTVALVGHQAPGTRGRALLDGADQLKLHGEYVPVRAEVVAVPGFSVHADGQALLAWMGAARRPPRVTYVVHGEPSAAQALRAAISRELGWHAVVPRHGERVRLR
jgi:metallo-beta-lactamase family protein